MPSLPSTGRRCSWCRTSNMPWRSSRLWPRPPKRSSPRRSDTAAVADSASPAATNSNAPNRAPAPQGNGSGTAQRGQGEGRGPGAARRDRAAHRVAAFLAHRYLLARLVDRKSNALELTPGPPRRAGRAGRGRRSTPPPPSNASTRRRENSRAQSSRCHQRDPRASRQPPASTTPCPRSSSPP